TGSWSGTKANINDVNSLEAFVYNGNVELLAATQLGQLFEFTDTNGINNNFDAAFLANVTPSAAFTIANSASFRGMAILPTAVPEPMAMTLLAAAIPFFVGCRRRSR
ncbi:MAG TPA: hypothetical protein VH107_08665, partial [Lacipirellulaceae bacterium]|nr:hypothetical protein [Lacipirellulaceae bacterium]